MTATPARPARIETVLLDAGGVLLDLDYGYLRRLLAARGHDLGEDVLARAEAVARTEVDRKVRSGGRGSDAWRDYFRILLSRVRFPAREHEPIIDSLWEAHRRFGMWTVPIDGAPGIIRVLKGLGYRLGVVSNAEGRVEQDLESAGFAEMFETVVDSSVVGVEKPDPAIFRIALDRMGVSAATAMFLGDVPSIDVEGAKAAGITPVLLDRFGLYPETLVPRLRSISELPDWLATAE